MPLHYEVNYSISSPLFAVRIAYYAFAVCFGLFLMLYILRGIGWLTILPGGILLVLGLGSWLTGLWSILTFWQQRY